MIGTGEGGSTFEFILEHLRTKVAELEKKVIYLELGLAQLRQAAQPNPNYPPNTQPGARETQQAMHIQGKKP